jgi:hypothetical protein
MKIVFFKGKDIFSKFVCWWTGGDWSHCEIMFIGQGGVEYSFSANTRTGVTLQKSESVYLHYTGCLQETIGLPFVDQSELTPLIDSELGCGYDWIGIFFTQGIPLQWESSTKWFCSELCAKIVQMIIPLNRRFASYNPSNLYKELKSKT